MSHDDPTPGGRLVLHREALTVGLLTPQEDALLDVLVDRRLARENMPIPQRRIVNRFEKFLSPIGLDESGELLPLPPWPEDQ